MSGKRRPTESSFGPVSGLTPVKFRWSSISITSPGPKSGSSAPGGIGDDEPDAPRAGAAAAPPARCRAAASPRRGAAAPASAPPAGRAAGRSPAGRHARARSRAENPRSRHRGWRPPPRPPSASPPSPVPRISATSAGAPTRSATEASAAASRPTARVIAPDARGDARRQRLDLGQRIRRGRARSAPRRAPPAGRRRRRARTSDLAQEKTRCVSGSNSGTACGRCRSIRIMSANLPGSSDPSRSAAPSAAAPLERHHPERLRRRDRVGVAASRPGAASPPAAAPSTCRGRCPRSPRRSRASPAPRPRSMSGTRAMPLASFRFDTGLCATVAPVRARIAISSSSSQTQCASTVRASSSPSASRCRTTDRP